jgi:uncharacterized membrane protein (UPF0127 family)
MVHRDTRFLTRLPAGLLGIAAALVLCAAGEPGQPEAPEPPPPPPPPREKVVIGGEAFKLEIAADPVSRARGLMGREEIKEHGGMLFVYRDARRLTFWMKNCLVDIDLIYLNANGRVVRWHKMKKVPPRAQDETEGAYEWRLMPYRSGRPAQFVIELKAGSIDRLKIKAGETIALDRSRLRKMAR